MNQKYHHNSWKESLYLSLFQFLRGKLASVSLVDLLKTSEKKGKEMLSGAQDEKPVTDHLFKRYTTHLFTPSSNSWLFGSCFSPS